MELDLEEIGSRTGRKRQRDCPVHRPSQGIDDSQRQTNRRHRKRGATRWFIVTRRGVGLIRTDYGDFYQFDFGIDDNPWEKYSVIVNAEINGGDMMPVFKKLRPAPHTSGFRLRDRASIWRPHRANAPRRAACSRTRNHWRCGRGHGGQHPSARWPGVGTAVQARDTYATDVVEDEHCRGGPCGRLPTASSTCGPTAALSASSSSSGYRRR